MAGSGLVVPADTRRFHHRLAPDSTWKPSRSDVAVRVVEQHSTRSVVALDGPAGEVNVALVTSTNGKPRTVCSWKVEIAENAAAAGRTTV
jgi:hypothetical protein